MNLIRILHFSCFSELRECAVLGHLIVCVRIRLARRIRQEMHLHIWRPSIEGGNSVDPNSVNTKMAILTSHRLHYALFLCRPEVAI